MNSQACRNRVDVVRQRGRRGALIIGDVMFLVLTVTFITVLIVFVSRQSSAGHVLEELWAKKISLMIDGAEAGSDVRLNVAELLHKDVTGAVVIDSEHRLVTVKLSDKGGYTYGYFRSFVVSTEIEGDYLVVRVR